MDILSLWRNISRFRLISNLFREKTSYISCSWLNKVQIVQIDNNLNQRLFQEGINSLLYCGMLLYREVQLSAYVGKKAVINKGGSKTNDNYSPLFAYTEKSDM